MSGNLDKQHAESSNVSLDLVQFLHVAKKAGIPLFLALTAACTRSATTLVVPASIADGATSTSPVDATFNAIGSEVSVEKTQTAQANQDQATQQPADTATATTVPATEQPSATVTPEPPTATQSEPAPEPVPTNPATPTQAVQTPLDRRPDMLTSRDNDGNELALQQSWNIANYGGIVGGDIDRIEKGQGAELERDVQASALKSDYVPRGQVRTDHPEHLGMGMSADAAIATLMGEFQPNDPRVDQIQVNMPDGTIQTVVLFDQPASGNNPELVFGAAQLRSSAVYSDAVPLFQAVSQHVVLKDRPYTGNALDPAYMLLNDAAQQTSDERRFALDANGRFSPIALSSCQTNDNPIDPQKNPLELVRVDETLKLADGKDAPWGEANGLSPKLPGTLQIAIDMSAFSKWEAQHPTANAGARTQAVKSFMRTIRFVTQLRGKLVPADYDNAFSLLAAQFPEVVAVDGADAFPCFHALAVATATATLTATADQSAPTEPPVEQTPGATGTKPKDTETPNPTGTPISTATPTNTPIPINTLGATNVPQPTPTSGGEGLTATVVFTPGNTPKPEPSSSPIPRSTPTVFPSNTPLAVLARSSRIVDQKPIIKTFRRIR